MASAKGLTAADISARHARSHRLGVF